MRRGLDLHRDKTGRRLAQKVDLRAVIAPPAMEGVPQPPVCDEGAQFVQHQGLQERPGLLLRRRIGQPARKRARDASVEEVELGVPDLFGRPLQLPRLEPAADQACSAIENPTLNPEARAKRRTRRLA